MINLFNFETYNIDTSQFSNILHDRIVTDFENLFARYVGAKYACAINSATNAIFLTFQDKCVTVKVPSMIPPVVVNSIVTNNKNLVEFQDDISWIGSAYVLHEFDDYKIIDSAQQVDKDQFKTMANPQDIMIFSFYPTKPVAGCDGGMIVSNDSKKMEWYRQAVYNGTSDGVSSWERRIMFPGWKMYLNSIQAFIGLHNLLLYDQKLQELSHIRNYYNMQLGYDNHSNHLYTIKVRDNKEFLEFMREKGIQCGIHYEPLHMNKVYDKYSIDKKPLPITEASHNRITSIPFHHKLGLGDISYVCQCVKKYQRS
jgi:dTDP-4-amino-4,6-dideoxygalactose transaminase